jgi:hypothetical protein
MAEKKKYKPILVGTIHEEELYEIYKNELSRLADKGIKSVALELPPDAPARGKVDESTFFYRLRDFAKRKGLKVMQIDSGIAKERTEILMLSLTLALNPKESRLKELHEILSAEKSVDWKMEKLKGVLPMTPKKENIPFYKRVVDLSLGKSGAKILYDMTVLADLRNKYMLRQIRKRKPDAILLGGMHSRYLEPKLGVKMLDPDGLVKKSERGATHLMTELVTMANLKLREHEKKANREKRKKRERIMEAEKRRRLQHAR